MNEGLSDELRTISPIKSYDGTLELYFTGKVIVEKPKYTEQECLVREVTFCAPLKVEVKLVNRQTKEVKVQEVFIGDLPLMTERATFIINGAERVIISQLTRSPGVYFKSSKRIEKVGRHLYYATIIPDRGSWLEIVTDWAEGEFRNRTLKESPIISEEEALIEIYKKLRPGGPVTFDGAKNYLHNLFFNPKRYDLSVVGRHKMNIKLDLNVEEEITVLTKKDILGIIKYLVQLHMGEGLTDDIDHLGNRRVRSVGELLQRQFRIGFTRVERLIKEQMTIKGPSATPQALINVRPLSAVIKEFFGSSQLSQFMDQTNPLAELTHKRRLSALGPGGLTRERAGFEVRDIHPSHYGRVCPIETPEGPNAGLIGSLSTHAKVNKYGFIETPYFKVTDGVVSGRIEYLTADVEDLYHIASCDVRLDSSKKIKESQVTV